MSTKVFVNGKTLAVAAIGLVMGLLAVLTIGGLLESALFGVSSTGPRIGTAVATGVAVVALVAAYLPAKQPAAIAPVAALRSE
jgi:hypothetical protein